MTFDHHLNPILFEIGPFSVRYYGLFIILGIFFALFLWRLLLKKDRLKFEIIFNLLIWLMIGGTVGARLGEVFFYEPRYYFANPLEIIMIHHGGFSSHGLTLGLMITFFLFIKTKKINASEIIDLVITPLPILICLIRLANFINSEIVGRPTNGNFGVRFYLLEENPVLRHPSQIYEAILGLLIFPLILWSYFYFNRRLQKPYFTFIIFLLAYFISRFLVEFFKDDALLKLGSPLTMGQYLSLPFILGGVISLILLYRKQRVN